MIFNEPVIMIQIRLLATALALSIPTIALADSCKIGCGKVVSVTVEMRAGKASAVGTIGGAVVGGLLGHQLGQGTGNTVATIAGAAGGAYAGREVEKKVTQKKIHIVTVRMDDGTIRKFEFAKSVPVLSGDRVHVVRNRIHRYSGN